MWKLVNGVAIFGSIFLILRALFTPVGAGLIAICLFIAVVGGMIQSYFPNPITHGLTAFETPAQIEANKTQEERDGDARYYKRTVTDQSGYGN